ncbi:MAG: hypothetical protein KGS45_09270 [Planctomycetes bacterium]|nr:hypothetical protein [Planctomycetota bacterium]
MLTPPRDIQTFTLLGDLNDLARQSHTMLVAELARWDSLPHSCLKPGESRSVWRITTSTEIVTLKCRRHTIGNRLRNLVQRTPLHREIRGSEFLKRDGIATVTPLALYSGQGVHCLALRHVPGRTLLECIADSTLSASARLEIAQAVGTQLVQIGRAGICNRDHKPSNLIVDETVKGGPLITVIDPAGIFQSPVPGCGMPHMLASLFIEPTGCGVPPNKRDIVRVVRAVFKRGKFAHWKSVRDLLGAARDIVMQHGDPTPAVNPLAQGARG